MRIPTPSTADTEEKRQLFEGALRLRHAVLLWTALKMIDHTLAMAQRTGERSDWVERGRAARAAVENEVRAEQAALDKLPFSRQTLEGKGGILARLSREACSGTLGAIHYRGELEPWPGTAYRPQSSLCHS